MAAHAKRVVVLRDGADHRGPADRAGGRPAPAPVAQRGAAVNLENVRIALRGIRANRLRSALTMLGIMIGVGAVIVLVAVGNGSSQGGPGPAAEPGDQHAHRAGRGLRPPGRRQQRHPAHAHQRRRDRHLRPDPGARREPGGAGEVDLGRRRRGRQQLHPRPDPGHDRQHGRHPLLRHHQRLVLHRATTSRTTTGWSCWAPPWSRTCSAPPPTRSARTSRSATPPGRWAACSSR